MHVVVQSKVLGKSCNFCKLANLPYFAKKGLENFPLLLQVQVVSNRQLGKTLFCFRENERNISFPPFEAMRKSCKRPFFFLSRLGKKKKNCLRTTVGFPDPWRKSRIRTRWFFLPFFAFIVREMIDFTCAKNRGRKEGSRRRRGRKCCEGKKRKNGKKTLQIVVAMGKLSVVVFVPNFFAPFIQFPKKSMIRKYRKNLNEREMKCIEQEP